MNRRFGPALAWAVLYLGLMGFLSGPVWAGSDWDPVYDESMDGFENTDGDEAFFKSDTSFSMEDTEKEFESAIQSKGFIKEELAGMPEHDDPGISSIKTTVNASVEAPLSDAIRIKASGQAYYDAAFEMETRDRYKALKPGSLEWDAELRDTWVDLTLPKGWYVRFGKQIAAWGESEVFRLNDRVNPRDIREPGRTELEDARLPVFSTLLDYYAAPYRISAVALHEENRDLKAPEASDFDYFASARSPGVTITGEQEPDVSLSEPDVYVKFTRFFNGGDVSLYAASAHEQEPFLAYNRLENGVLYMTPEYGKTPSAGLSANVASGSFLVKAEGAFFHDMPFQCNDLEDQLASDPFAVPVSTEKRDTAKFMAGFDYSGFDTITLTLEGYSEIISGNTDHIDQDKTTGAFYGSFRAETLHSTLDIILNTLYMIQGRVSMSKVLLSYDIMDALTLEGGVMLYHCEDETSPYSPYKKNDMVFSSLRFSY